MLKKVIKGIVGGIAWGCVFSTVVNMIGSSIGGNQWFEGAGFSYTHQAIMSMIAGIAWIVPSMVYQNERLSLGMQTLIHMTIGFGVFIPVALYMEWIPSSQGVGAIVTTMIAIIFGTFAIWSCFYFYYRHEAKRMNDKIKLLNQ